ncbi:MAG: 4-hydroxy-tetrahydrodipicolinate reductase, partial [Planctomycetota bacterium]|nr:4-hydroxy-tetrahydrodipicolinate reductase [Planctomycetota bacterium]
MALPVAVIGARGRMGRFAVELLGRSDDFEIAAALDVDDDLDAALAKCGAALGLDLTVAGLGCDHGLLMLEHGLRPVIGTSGVSLEENERLDRRARELALGGLVVPNFSLG